MSSSKKQTSNGTRLFILLVCKRIIEMSAWGFKSLYNNHRANVMITPYLSLITFSLCLTHSMDSSLNFSQNALFSLPIRKGEENLNYLFPSWFHYVLQRWTYRWSSSRWWWKRFRESFSPPFARMKRSSSSSSSASSSWWHLHRIANLHSANCEEKRHPTKSQTLKS